MTLAQPSDWLSGEDGLLYSSNAAQVEAVQAGYVTRGNRTKEIETFKMACTDGEWHVPREARLDGASTSVP